MRLTFQPFQKPPSYLQGRNKHLDKVIDGRAANFLTVSEAWSFLKKFTFPSSFAPSVGVTGWGECWAFTLNTSHFSGLCWIVQRTKRWQQRPTAGWVHLRAEPRETQPSSVIRQPEKITSHFIWGYWGLERYYRQPNIH